MDQPEWLTAEFVERVLRSADNDKSISVTEISVTNATNKGDNYASEIFRVKFELTRDEAGTKVNEESSIIVKAAFSTGGKQKDLVEEIKLFDNEINMMTSALTDMEFVLKDTKLSGRCYYFQLKDPTLLVIEDLVPLGFRMADRQVGLDLQHCTLALQRLAKFHASSVLVCENTPKYKEDFRKGLFFVDCPAMLIELWTNGIKSLVKTAKSWAEVSVELIEKLKKMADNFFPKACKVAEMKESEFNVINHGDFWINNMMFKYDNKDNVVDHIFVDFQICNYGSPALDLQYFFHTSVSEQVLVDYKNYLIKEYVKTLPTTMKKIGCKTHSPNLGDIRKMLIEREIIGFIMASAALPFLLLDKSQARNLNELLEDNGDIYSNAYNNEVYKKIIVRRLQEWDTLGLFDENA